MSTQVEVNLKEQWELVQEVLLAQLEKAVQQQSQLVNLVQEQLHSPLMDQWQVVTSQMM